MQLNGWKNFWLTVWLVSSVVNFCCIAVDRVGATALDRYDCQEEQQSRIKSLLSYQKNIHQCQNNDLDIAHSKLQQSDLFELTAREQIQSNFLLLKRQIAQSQPEADFSVQEDTRNSQIQDKSPQLEVQQRDFIPSSPTQTEELNQSQFNRTERLDRLRKRLREVSETTLNESDELPELGLRVRPKPLPQKPPLILLEQPIVIFKPIGNLQARLGYYHTNNIFSSDIDPIEDGLIFYGLRIASVYFPIGSQTYLNGSIDGNLIRYVDQSIFSYNQIKFDLSVYQQLSPRIYGAIGLSNQQFFYVNNSDRFQAGDRFLGENSLRLLLVRQDPLTSALTLNSLYEFKANFSDPDSRSRIINSGLISLNYKLQQSLRIGVNYQLNLSNFTQRTRTDYYHRLFGQLSYQTSNFSNLNLQTGLTFGGSTDTNIDFDGWFFSINYNWQLGQF